MTAMTMTYPSERAFYGRWIYEPTRPLEFRDDDGTAEFYAVAETAKGQYVFHWWVGSFPDDVQYGYKFTVYPSLESAASDKRINIERKGDKKTWRAG